MEKVNSKWEKLLGEYDLKSEQDTVNLAKKTAAIAGPGDTLALYGDLGAGKTFFTQKFCRFLGIKEIVSSPSYVLINQYSGEVQVNHVDLYRLSSYEEVLELGIYEMLSGNITVIEWPEIAEEILPENTLHIHLIFENSHRKAIVKV